MSGYFLFELFSHVYINSPFCCPGGFYFQCSRGHAPQTFLFELFLSFRFNSLHCVWMIYTRRLLVKIFSLFVSSWRLLSAIRVVLRHELKVLSCDRALLWEKLFFTYIPSQLQLLSSTLSGFQTFFFAIPHFEGEVDSCPDMSFWVAAEQHLQLTSRWDTVWS